MTTSLSLPPSYRDFQIYERVVIEALSTRQAAGEFSRSQTRIRQIVQRVSQWLTENLPPQDDATDAAYLRYAQHVAADRLSFFYSQAMDGWRVEHQMKYMNLVIRLTLAQSKLPVIPGTLECLAADAIERGADIPVCQEGEPERQNDGENESALSPSSGSADKNVCPTSPPLRDCSPSQQNSQPSAASPAVPPSINQTLPSASAKVPPQASAARRAFLAPAHPAQLPGDLPITELTITPQQLGFASTPIRSVSEGSLPLTRSVSEGSRPTRSLSQRRLSRRERRKLRRTKANA